MVSIELQHPADAAGWRSAARRLLADGVRPEAVTWRVRSGPGEASHGERQQGAGSAGPVGAVWGDSADLFAAAPLESDPGVGEPSSLQPVCKPRVPRGFMELAERVACHRSPQRFGLLYRVLWRLQHEQARLLDNAADADVHAVYRLGKAVSRDRHKMHAFVRFRATPGASDPHFTAWFEPSHRIERLAAGFFCRRFATMRFSIFTPEESVHWDTERVRFGAGGTRDVVSGEDGMEALWCEYFANIFNPARLKLDAMRAEMPVKYWKNLPEAPLIAALTRDAGRRTADMVAADATVAPRFARAAGLPDAARALQESSGTADDPS